MYASNIFDARVNEQFLISTRLPRDHVPYHFLGRDRRTREVNAVLASTLPITDAG